jgi:hypothetical protein
MRLRFLHLALPLSALAVSGCPEKQSSTATSSQPSAEAARPAASIPSVVRAPGPAFERFAMPGVQGLIVGEAEAGRFYAAITGGTSPRYWTPEKAHLIDLETRLGGYLRSKAPPKSRLRKDLRSYRRQYIGIVRGERRVVFASFFCETNRQDWTRKPIAVDDGGDCFFQLQFDPEKHAFSGLIIQKGG